MIKLILFLVAFVPLLAQADNLIKPGLDDSSLARYMFLKDATGATVPAVVVYTSDGSGNIIPLSSSGTATTVSQGNAGSAAQAWFIQAVTLPLPTNAAQETGGHLASLDAKIGSPGQATMAGSTPVVIASNQTAIPITGNITASNASVGLNGSTAPTSSNQIGGVNLSGNLEAAVVTSGALKVNGSGATQPISAASLPLPTGGSTSGLQTLGNASLSSLDSKIPSQVAGKLPVDGSGVTQPISATALPLPAGAATEVTLSDVDNAVDSLDAKFSPLGQNTMANSTPVVIASNQSPVTITGTVSLLNPVAALIGAAAPLAGVQIGGPDNTNHLQAVTVNSGAMKVDPSSFTAPVAVSSSVLPTGAATSANQSTANGSISSIDSKTPALVGGKVPVDGSGVTQPISAASLPLPSGAATAVNQASANTTLTTINGKIASLGAATTANSSPVNIASDQVVPISASGLPLPSGASTAANQSTEIASLASIDSKLGSLGQKTMAVSAPVVIASDQSPIPVSGTVTETNASIGVNGATAPSSSTQIAGVDGSGNLSAASIVAGAVKVNGSSFTQPVSGSVSVSGTVVANAGSGTFTVGQATGSNLHTVVDSGALTANIGTTGGLALDSTLSSAQGAPNATAPANTKAVGGLDGGGKLQTLSVSTSGKLNIEGGNTTAVKVDGSATTQPVSGAVSVSGTVTSNAGSGTFTVGQSTGANLHANIDNFPSTQPVSGTVAVSNFPATQPISAVSLPLPTNAAIETGGHLASLDSKVPSQGQALMAASSPVVIASNQSAVPVSGTVTSNAGTGTFVVGQTTGTNLHTVVDSGALTANIGTTNGLALDATVSGLQSTTTAAAPAKATPIAGKDGSNNLQNISVTTAGKVNVEGGNAVALKTDGSATTQPISGTVTSNAGTGNFTVVQGTGTNLHAVVDSGAITANIGTTGGLAIDASVTGLQVAQASTTSGQKGTLGQGAVSTGPPTYTTATTNALSLTTAGALRTDSSATTQPISASALPLPSNAAQETGGNLAALNAKFGTLGQKTSAGSQPVVLASDQSSIPVSQSGTWSTRIQDTSGTGINSQSISAAQYLNVVQPSTATAGAAVPGRSNLTSGQDGSGNSRNFSVDTSGNLNANVLANVTSADKTTSGALTAACATGVSCGAGSTVALAISGVSSGLLTLSGTWSGTVVLDCSVDSFTTFKSLSLLNKTGGAMAASVSINGYYEPLSIDSCAQVRARMSVFTSGSATTQINASSGTGFNQVASLSAAQFFTTSNTNDGNGVAINSVSNALNTNTKTSLTANAPFTVSVGVTSAAFLASNASRKGFCTVNTSSAIVSYGIGAAAVLNSGITLYPGGTWCMDEYTFSTAAINAIAGAAASATSGQEFQ